MFLLLGFVQCIDIISNGKSDYFIVVAATNGRMPTYYKTAAEELNIAFQAIADVELPIEAESSTTHEKAIYLGPCNKSNGKVRFFDIDDETYEIVTDETNIYINGGKRGVCYGVFDYLEKFLNVRWYTSWWTVMPKNSTIYIPSNLVMSHTPSVPYREIYADDPMFNTTLKAHFRNNGGDSGNAGNYGGALGARYGTHSFFGFDRTKYPLSKYPQCYAMNPDGGRYTDALCLSNKDTWKFASERVLEDIKADIQKNGKNTAYYIELSQGDNGRYCHCSECTEKFHEYGDSCSGLHVEFLNRMCNEIQKLTNDFKVRTFLLSDSVKCPTNILPNSHIYFRTCPIGNDHGRPLSIIPEENFYSANQDFILNMEKWRNITGHFTLYDYSANFDSQGAFPHHLIYGLASDLKLFVKRYKIDGYLPEDLIGSSKRRQFHADMAELKSWMLSHLMYDIDLDIEELVRDFCDGYYGPESSEIVQNILNKGMYQVYRGTQPVYYTSWGGLGQNLDEDFLRWSVAQWDKAIKSAKNEDYKYHNKMSSLTSRCGLLYFVNRNDQTLEWTSTTCKFVPKNEEEKSALLLNEYIHESIMDVAKYYEKWRALSEILGNPHSVKSINSGQYEAWICPDVRGMCGHFSYNGINYIGQNYGIDFRDITDNTIFQQTSWMNYNITESSSTSITLKNISGSITITKKFVISNNGLSFEGSIVNGNRAVAQIELLLGGGDQIAWKYNDENEWIQKAVDSLAEFEHFGISSPKIGELIIGYPSGNGIILNIQSELMFIKFLCNVTSKSIRVALVPKTNLYTIKYTLKSYTGTLPNKINRPTADYNETKEYLRRFIIDNTMWTWSGTTEMTSFEGALAGSVAEIKSGTFQIYMSNYFKYNIRDGGLYDTYCALAIESFDPTSSQFTLMHGCSYLDAEGNSKEVYYYPREKNFNGKFNTTFFTGKQNWSFKSTQGYFVQHDKSARGKTYFDRLELNVIKDPPEIIPVIYDNVTFNLTEKLPNHEYPDNDGKTYIYDDDIKRLSTGEIAGIVLCCILVVVIAVVAVFLYLKYKKSKDDKSES
ncbi:DUF4838 domain-containing protein [Histomonas meleagridis]|uniref:DUF4838 domain-containing protein n=1 Tax=Histomonas meleagridis TaxID=135588 RepID=UPI00355ACD28|nr:DUF4838 domain-containing protein [Histomonas meleagridis]KAH0800335.1 DUF4838 domain-containing protein [Histomonas meleagridis]